MGELDPGLSQKRIREGAGEGGGGMGGNLCPLRTAENCYPGR